MRQAISLSTFNLGYRQDSSRADHLLEKIGGRKGQQGSNERKRMRKKRKKLHTKEWKKKTQTKEERNTISGGKGKNKASGSRPTEVRVLW